MAEKCIGIPVGIAQDLTGKTFGFVFVIEWGEKKYSPSGNYRNMWKGKCTCGNERLFEGRSLVAGRTKSCGCKKGELSSNKKIVHGMSQSRREGRPATRMYRIWADMKKRCDNQNHSHYIHYGGRGISYQNSWAKFKSFYEDMKDSYADDLTLDRTNNDGNYTKENCRWATRLVQGNNTRRNRFIFFRGEKRTVSDWCRHLNLPMKTIHARLKAGWSVEQALSQPVGNFGWLGFRRQPLPLKP